MPESDGGKLPRKRVSVQTGGKTRDRWKLFRINWGKTPNATLRLHKRQDTRGYLSEGTTSGGQHAVGHEGV